MRTRRLLALACGLLSAEAAFPQDFHFGGGRVERAAARAARDIPGFYDVPEYPYQFDVEKDIRYRDDGEADRRRHTLDLYVPKGKEDFPVFFFVHGGAWRSGNKDLYGRIGEMFAGNGVGAVIINYRLSPAVQHPAHILDVAEALSWTYQNIGKYGGRKDCIFAAGHSAGAHLVALLATDQSYLEKERVPPEAIRGVIPMSGIYMVLPDMLFQSVFGTNAELRQKAFPITHVVKEVAKKLPPFLVVYAEDDLPTIDGMSRGFHRALRAVDVESEELLAEGRSHISLVMSLMVPTDPTTQAVLKFIREHADAPKDGDDE